MEVASWAEELVCCLVRLAPQGCHDGMYSRFVGNVWSMVIYRFD